MVFMLRRVVEQATERQIRVFVMDCDVAAAFDHVSHHELIKATLGPMGVGCCLDQRIPKLRNTGEAGLYCDTVDSSHKVGGHKVILARLVYLGRLWSTRRDVL